MSGSNQDELLNHEYDGIREFDNPTPGWWNWLFLISVVFSVGYFFYYHIGGMGASIASEYQAEVKEQQKKDAELAAKSPGVTENGLLALAADPARVAAGKAKFTTVCLPCHGDKGQGIIGPNLTDAYWIHGKGDLVEIHKVVDQGVLEKGMPAWGKMMSPAELKDVVAFVGSLKNTNVAGKAPQGMTADGTAAPGTPGAPGQPGAATSSAAAVAAPAAAPEAPAQPAAAAN